MACSGALATGWQFVSFWCIDQIITGYDDSGGVGNAFVTDSLAEFITNGVLASVGMVLYNLTKNTNGEVTAISDTTLTATGVVWDDGDLYRIVPITRKDIARLNMMLELSAGSIHAARAASGGCDCTVSAWASDYLAQLNVVSAAIMFTCPCGDNLTDERKASLMEWLDAQLMAIREGKLELCAGATGADFPAIAIAQYGNTDWNKARIVYNDIMKNL